MYNFGSDGKSVLGKFRAVFQISDSVKVTNHCLARMHRCLGVLAMIFREMLHKQ
jgi:hypothetical protein